MSLAQLSAILAVVGLENIAGHYKQFPISVL